MTMGVDEERDDERELALAAASGDRRAFETLWGRYQPRLLRYLSSLGTHDREDVANQVWLEVFRALPRLDGRSHGFRRLLFTIAHRRMVDEIRRRSRTDPSLLPVPEPERGADAALTDLDSALALLRRLPAAQAEVVALRVLGDMSASEVGEVTGRSEGAVRVMGHRALRALQDLLTDEAAGDGEFDMLFGSDVTAQDFPTIHSVQ